MLYSFLPQASLGNAADVRQTKGIPQTPSIKFQYNKVRRAGVNVVAVHFVFLLDTLSVAAILWVQNNL